MGKDDFLQLPLTESIQREGDNCQLVAFETENVKLSSAGGCAGGMSVFCFIRETQEKSIVCPAKIFATIKVSAKIWWN